MIALIVILAPTLVLAILGYFVGNIIHLPVAGAIIPVIFWFGFLIATGWTTVQEQEYLVIEQFGKFDSVKFRGINILLLPGIIDEIKEGSKGRGSLAAREIELYNDPEKAEIDFQNSSAPISARAWYHVGNPEYVASGKWKEVAKDVRNWTYMFNDPEERVRNLIEGDLRPRLQAYEIDDAQAKTEDIVKETAENVPEKLKAVGAYLREERPIIIEDIDLPEETIQIRQRKLEAEVAKITAEINADAAKAGAGQYYLPILEFKKAREEAGTPTTFDEAEKGYIRQLALQTLQKAGANITIVGGDMDGVLKAITLNPKGGS